MRCWLRKGIRSTRGSGGDFECGAYGALTIGLSIGQFLVVGLLAGRQSLLERQALVLIGLLRGRGCLGQLIEGVCVQPRQ